ncbi:futalosine hydrolase [Xylanibacillus composti]|uniref:Futalosine hydrolase n=1 Tax=Xylanibacillus composti TaxID=1572762 RepID=A0A8J4M2Y9_9BACL|nr:futalosine hydrolase [Xylanibacillus composti]MDT9726381.1 futalosine hydrolase [Xylanibacillus composti]GIQ70380.1 Futalosine hydrolase [Xylanibacillus composti]
MKTEDSSLRPQGRVLIVTAVPAERDAIASGLNGCAQVDVIAGGVGPAFAAAAAAKALSEADYALVVSAGIGGGFPERAEVGSLVLADHMIAADWGAETLEGFASVDELGFGTASFSTHSGLTASWQAALQNAGASVAVGPILTVSTATGTARTAALLAARLPGAAAEAMEGCGVAAAAQLCGLPVMEIRAISNRVGPRDRESWRIPEALERLQTAGKTLLEVLQ